MTAPEIFLATVILFLIVALAVKRAKSQKAASREFLLIRQANVTGAAR